MYILFVLIGSCIFSIHMICPYLLTYAHSTVVYGSVSPILYKTTLPFGLWTQLCFSCPAHLATLACMKLRAVGWGPDKKRGVFNPPEATKTNAAFVLGGLGHFFFASGVSRYDVILFE